ncbi:MAG: hypothetical protein IPJ65_26465 [Archangiaceae bacterium]|nr:hypothetical protein [Archangiaceae bacterium]
MIHAIVALLLTQDVPGLGSPPGALDGGEPFVSANGRCRNCHDRFISAEGDPLYLPYDGWVSTMMANSVRDPLFQAALSVANQDTPGVGSWCLRCHAPQSFIRGHNLPPDGGAFDALDTEGVTCDVCHRAVAAPDSGSPLIGNAQIYFDTSNVKYGPYPGVSSPEHSGSDAGITGSSELCGQCHQVSNPLVAWRNPEDGGVLGDQFPSTPPTTSGSSRSTPDPARCRPARTVTCRAPSAPTAARCGRWRSSPRGRASRRGATRWWAATCGGWPRCRRTTPPSPRRTPTSSPRPPASPKRRCATPPR